MTLNSPSQIGSNGVRQLIVDQDHAGRRIDNFLASILKRVPRSRIYRILRRGEVRVNGGRVRQNYRLESGDVLRIPPLRETFPPTDAVPPPKWLTLMLKDKVLYEDEGLIVLNKPPGIPVHGGTGFRYGVIEALRALRPQDPYLELVHRLDRGTSGCLMIAKQPYLLRQFHSMLRQGAVIKRYLTLVFGCWKGQKRLIAEELRKNVLRSGERMVEVCIGGKMAQTWMIPVELFASASLMQVRLLTGRRHQIRVHAAHIGHPVAGDTKYGDKSFNARMQGYGLRHLFLHAKSLSFQLPEVGRRISVETALPEDLVRVLERLRAEV